MAHLLSSLLLKESYHPISKTTITIDNSTLIFYCDLHLVFTLPPLLFADPYELAHYDHLYTSKSWGFSNLELPVSAVPQTNSYLLLSVLQEKLSPQVEVKLPLHLRYGDPSERSLRGYHSVEFTWPTGFLACPRSVTSDSSNSPRFPDNITSLFNASMTTLISIPNFGTNHAETLSVPIANFDDLVHVEFWTTFVVLLSLSFIVRASWVAFRRIDRPTNSFKID